MLSSTRGDLLTSDRKILDLRRPDRERRDVDLLDDAGIGRRRGLRARRALAAGEVDGDQLRVSRPHRGIEAEQRPARRADERLRGRWGPRARVPALVDCGDLRLSSEP